MVRSERRVSPPRATMCGTLALTVAALLAPCSSNAQVVTTYPSGQNIAPVYEGWEENPDGSFNLVFGHFNRNWEEEIDLPIGPNNHIEPGGPDQGQPTHFLPRRNRFLFRVRVPKDFGNKELVWTLTSHGKTERAYATLKADYFINDISLMNNRGAGGGGGGGNDTVGNQAPVFKVESAKTRTVKVGEPVTLTGFITDDDKPKRVGLPPVAPPSRERGNRGAGGGTPNSATGLRLSWFVYRGTGPVVFDPPQIDVWENYKEGANSPWAPGWNTPPTPPDGKWVTKATFNAPGTYVLRGLATDGGLSASEDITFVVQ